MSDYDNGYVKPRGRKGHHENRDVWSHPMTEDMKGEYYKSCFDHEIRNMGLSDIEIYILYNDKELNVGTMTKKQIQTLWGISRRQYDKHFENAVGKVRENEFLKKLVRWGASDKYKPGYWDDEMEKEADNLKRARMQELEKCKILLKAVFGDEKGKPLNQKSKYKLKYDSVSDEWEFID
jgi:hypothetical protein